MATSEALIKYYDCLKDSFSKIQDKDNTTALVNAALRPKIREELEKSKEVLDSYLNYIQVFSLIYSDKFLPICNSVISPLFKANPIQNISDKVQTNESDTSYYNATRVHETIEAIIKENSDLAEDFVHSIIKVFPKLVGREHGDDSDGAGLVYLKNCFKVCTYLNGPYLTRLVAKIVERINPPLPSSSGDSDDQAEIDKANKILKEAYDLIYECIDQLDGSQLTSITKAFVLTFSRDCIGTENRLELNHLLFYICSLGEDFPQQLIDALWSVFISPDRSLLERQLSVYYISSFISRANYISLIQVIDHLRHASSWCKEFISSNQSTKSSNSESLDCFQALFQSILYLITQRYREMYEEETIASLNELELDRIIESPLKPLSKCDGDILQRFQEVAALYHIARPQSILNLPARKKRRIDEPNQSFQPPFPEVDKTLSDRIRPLYRNYYDHRNFTIIRD